MHQLTCINSPATFDRMDPTDVLAAAHAHAHAEAALDMDATLATLVEDPVFEFFPSRLTIRGWDLIEQFYREQYPRFASKVLGSEVLGEWANEHTAVQEYAIEVRGINGPESYRVMSAFPVIDGKLAGERLFCDEGFLRVLLGDLFELCEPIDDTAP